ncbi:16852_t:CDS:2 [Funneliformis geosporum]|uniref:16852_t:CDS:1 n=1 Tax=Funneliformis geosporum TaxID=1117311 RepID=A0A9W4WR20_9GLOM|nr:16852_t:CDS:2 [Funneliformis geosporum]
MLSHSPATISKDPILSIISGISEFDFMRLSELRGIIVFGLVTNYLFQINVNFCEEYIFCEGIRKARNTSKVLDGLFLSPDDAMRLHQDATNGAMVDYLADFRVMRVSFAFEIGNYWCKLEIVERSVRKCAWN